MFVIVLVILSYSPENDYDFDDGKLETYQLALNQPLVMFHFIVTLSLHNTWPFPSRLDVIYIRNNHIITVGITCQNLDFWINHTM